MASKRIQQELLSLRSNPIERCTVELVQDEITQWKVIMNGPPGSPYEEGFFELRVTFSGNYPSQPPSVKFVTEVYHPNINVRGDICLDILKAGTLTKPEDTYWASHFTMRQVLLSILQLMKEPNARGALVPAIGKELAKQPEVFEKKASEMTSKHAKK